MPFTLITVTAAFLRPDGQPAQGTVTATLSERIQNGAQSIDPTPIVGVLNAAGDLAATSGRPFVLEASNDPATVPPGAVYRFVVALDSAPVTSFQAVVPYNAPAGTVDLSTLEPPA